MTGEHYLDALERTRTRYFFYKPSLKEVRWFILSIKIKILRSLGLIDTLLKKTS